MIITSPPIFPFQNYLYDLAKAVRELAPESRDSHLFALEVRSLFFLLGTC